MIKFIILLAILSCSNFSERSVLYDSVVFHDNSIQGDSGDRLNIKRVSWYSKATLEYDAYLGKVLKNSSFYDWFSENEKGQLNSCSEVLLTITRTNRSKVISDLTLHRVLHVKEAREIEAPDFHQSLILHPDFSQWNLSFYRSRIYCLSSPLKSLSIQIPSFKKAEINF
jgi:hypothetical protein